MRFSGKPNNYTLKDEFIMQDELVLFSVIVKKYEEENKMNNTALGAKKKILILSVKHMKKSTIKNLVSGGND